MLSALTLMLPLLLASGGGRCYLVTNTTIRVLPSCDLSPSAVDALTERSAAAPQAGTAPASQAGTAPASQTGTAPASQTEGAPASQTEGAPAWRGAAPMPSRNGRLAPAAPGWQRGARGRRLTGTGP